MRKRIDWQDRAKRELRAIDRTDAMDILRGLDHFSLTGKGDIKRLTDVDPPESRLRFGDYRVRFYELGDTLLILSINHRSRAYRR